MAKLKPERRKKKREKSVLNGVRQPNSPKKQRTQESPHALLAQATALLSSAPHDALPLAQRALDLLSPSSVPTARSLPASDLVGQIFLELGNPDAAREHFLAAAQLDPDGLVLETDGGGAAKFLWLAQLSEEGGKDSERWYKRGVTALRRHIAGLSDALGTNEKALVESKSKELANAFCGMAELYMTDLSWEEDAESRCEALAMEALLVAPSAPEPLQTIASIRISQTRFEDAKAALERSMSLWSVANPSSQPPPPFPTRVSLTRLLMEVDMNDEAMTVLEGLVEDDDESVEVWYLGGWNLYLMGMKTSEGDESSQPGSRRNLLKGSQDWLGSCLKLYSLQQYEDDRLRDHAVELTNGLKEAVGEDAGEEDEENGSGSDWVDNEDDDDDNETFSEDPTMDQQDGIHEQMSRS
ncbi:MAG: hypothetical protein M1833_005401 [Piccolia ochrophora]|nr:MAG: hypothetical protein M1833_005401 [Piccolia ochrophora]